MAAPHTRESPNTTGPTFPLGLPVCLLYPSVVCKPVQIFPCMRCDLTDVSTPTEVLFHVNKVKYLRRTILRYKETPGCKHWIMVFIWQWRQLLFYRSNIASLLGEV
jgi:hypothetical protein